VPDVFPKSCVKKAVDIACVGSIPKAMKKGVKIIAPSPPDIIANVDTPIEVRNVSNCNVKLSIINTLLANTAIYGEGLMVG
jgi:hypothetical protein